jgi:hypothetical protein
MALVGLADGEYADKASEFAFKWDEASNGAFYVGKMIITEVRRLVVDISAVAG